MRPLCYDQPGDSHRGLRTSPALIRWQSTWYLVVESSCPGKINKRFLVCLGHRIIHRIDQAYTFFFSLNQLLARCYWLWFGGCGGGSGGGGGSLPEYGASENVGATPSVGRALSHASRLTTTQFNQNQRLIFCSLPSSLVIIISMWMKTVHE